MKRVANFIYFALIACMLFLFFTNDFGLVDIRKSSIVVALGIDVDEDDLKVTAQVAIPQPSESGNATQCAQIDGSGTTVGEALNEINVKTGFYPKLTFCNLILLGESIMQRELFDVLDYFYRSDYIPRTAYIATCKGGAAELLAKQTATGEIPAEALGRALSDELKRTANVASINLKDLAVYDKSRSACCFMPYVDFSKAEGGAAIGAEASQSEGEKFQFFANATAFFEHGKYIGTLTEEQTFTLNLLLNDVRLAVLPVELDGVEYVLGIKNNKGGIKVKNEDGELCVAASFKGVAELRSSSSGEAVSYTLVSGEVMQAANDKLEGEIKDLFNLCAACDCDLLQLKTYLHTRMYSKYEDYQNSIYTLPLKTDVKIKSKN